MGAGTGYYTTLLAKLVGEKGAVDAYEIELEFARRAKENLAAFPQVTVHAKSGAEGPLPAPIGYLDTGKGNSKAIDPSRAPLVRQAFELYASNTYGLVELRKEMRKRGLRSKGKAMRPRRSSRLR